MMLEIKTTMNRIWTDLMNYIMSIFTIIIGYAVFLVYVLVFLKDENYSSGVLSSAIGVLECYLYMHPLLVLSILI